MREKAAGRFNWSGAAVALLLLAAWQALESLGAIQFEYVPSPLEVAEEFGAILVSGQLISNSWHTIAVAVAGWACAAVVGIAIGVTIGLVRSVWLYTMASIEVLRAIPIVAFVPIAVLLLGFSFAMEFVVTFYAALWPVVIAAMAGVRGVPKGLRETAATLGLSRFDALRKLVLPASAPSIVVGLRVALAIALILALVAEMVGNPAGIGSALVIAGQTLNPPQVFAYIFAIGMIGMALNSLLKLATRVLSPGIARLAEEAT